MKNVAKVTTGLIILLYALYGYSTGEIYLLPDKRGLGTLSVTGQGLVLGVLSYIAFAFLFYVWAVPGKTKFRKPKLKILKSPRDVFIAILFFLGITLQTISGVVE